MDMPPSRYRVVEQGRRLVVIDTQAGAPVNPVPPSVPEMPGEKRRRMEAPRAADRPAALRPPQAEPPGRYAGGEGYSFVTARWYDDEGPRRIRLSPDGQAQLLTVLLVLLGIVAFFAVLLQWVILFPLAFVLLNPKARGALRAAATTAITAVDKTEG
jgi:hypothetical protein